MGEKTRLSRILSGAAILLGLWLLFSPYILGYNSLETTAQQTVIGFIIIVVAGVRLSLPTIHWPSWINIILSIELILIPVTTAGVSGAAQLNMTVIGLVILVASAWRIGQHSQMPHRTLNIR